MLTRTAAEWEEYLQARHVPASRVRTMGEAVADPQLASRGVLHRFEGGAPGVPGGVQRAGGGVHVRSRWASGRCAAASVRRTYRAGAWRTGVRRGGYCAIPCCRGDLRGDL